MKSDTMRPSSWLELLDALFAGSWNPSLGRFRSPFAFRGQSIVREDLSSGLLRLAAGRPNVERLELHLLRHFRKYAFGAAAAPDTMWHWVPLGPHPRGPARALRLRESPVCRAPFPH